MLFNIICVFQKIPDAGHHVYADRSDIFNKVVTEICKAADKNSVLSHDKVEDLIQSFWNINL